MDLVKSLLAYQSSDLCQDVSLCQDFLALTEESGAFSRSNLKRHFTASAFVFDPKAKKVLLIEHKKLGMWFQPGGHADGDTDLLRVATKELEEETHLVGLHCEGQIFDIDRHEIPEHKGVPAHLHYDVRFLFLGDSTKLLPRANEELLDLGWFEVGDLNTLKTDASVRRMMQKALDR